MRPQRGRRLLPALALLLLAAPLTPLRAEGTRGLVPGEWDRWLDRARHLASSRTERSRHQARVLYECLARYDATPHGIEARYRLACLYARSGHHAHHLPSAVLLWQDLASRFDHEPSRERLEALRTTLVPRKEALLEAARRSMEKGRPEAARSALLEALRLPFTVRGQVGEAVGEEEILTLLLNTLPAVGDESSLDTLRSACPTCRGQGYLVCPTCKGKGRVRELVRLPQGVPKVRSHRCPRCRGLGKVPCHICAASGWNVALFPDPEKKRVSRFLGHLAGALEAKDLSDAVRLAVTSCLACRLRLPLGLRQDDVEVLRLLPSSPRSPLPRDYLTLWREADRAGRHNLLADLAVVTARTTGTSHFFLGRPPARHPSRTSLDLERHPLVPPLWLGAFAGPLSGRWVSVRGVLGGLAPSRAFPGMREVVLRDVPKGPVRWVAWSSEGLEALRNLALRWAPRSHLGEYLSSKAVSGTAETLASLETGCRVTLSGRLWCGSGEEASPSGSWPWAVFEIWRLGTGGSGPQPPAAEEADADDASASDPLGYVEARPLDQRWRTWSRAPGEELLEKALAALARARERGLAHKERLGFRGLWSLAEPLEEARDVLRVLVAARPGNELAPRLLRHVLGELLAVYREAGRK